MATFTYKGTAVDGTVKSGLVEAFDEIEAMELAREQVSIVQSVEPVRATKNFLTADIGKPKIKPKNLAVMCSQFAIILKAGLAANRAIALVAEQTTDKYLKKVLTDIESDVAAGHGIADSFESKAPDMPRVFTETVRAGEESGRLPESFERLQSYYDKRAKVGAKVAGALTYPIFVAVIGVIVVIVMMVMVIPALTGFISGSGGEMPLPTQILINVSDWFVANWMWFLLVIALIVVGIKLYGRTEKGKELFGTLKLRFPVIGSIGVFSGAAQFANTMATLSAAGLPMTRAVQVTSRVLDNYILSRDVGRMEVGLQEGRSLGECMQESKFFPHTLTEMTAVGEQTGELEETLATIGEFYDSETQRVTDRALGLLEPAMMVVLAVFAGFIVIALYLPMFTMYANM